MWAIADGARNLPGLDISVVAAKGSHTGMPQITIDRAQLGTVSREVDCLLLQSLVMAGGWKGYDLVHCLAQAPGACQLHLESGGRLLYTPPNAPDAGLLAAFARLGVARGEAVTSMSAVERAWHPVDPTVFSFDPGGHALVTAGAAPPAESRLVWRPTEHPGSLVDRSPALVLGPSASDGFTHLRWLVRSLARGALYLHDCPDIPENFGPVGGVVRRDGPLDAQVEALLSAPSDREALRRWALANCAPSATAARLRRLYDGIRAAD